MLQAVNQCKSFCIHWCFVCIPGPTAVLNLFLCCYSLLGLKRPFNPKPIQPLFLSYQPSSVMTSGSIGMLLEAPSSCVVRLEPCRFTSWLHGKFFVGSRCAGELLIERKHCVKRCELIIADRYWLASHFLYCWQLGGCYLGCVMPQSGNKDGGKMHTDTQRRLYW